MFVQQQSRISTLALPWMVVASLSLLVGCGGAVSVEAQQAAIARCVAKQTDKLPEPQITGNPTPEMRAQLELAAKQANEALAKMSRSACEKTITETCKQSSSACKKLISEG
jgi:hypothetical protein